MKFNDDEDYIKRNAGIIKTIAFFLVAITIIFILVIYSVISIFSNDKIKYVKTHYILDINNKNKSTESISRGEVIKKYIPYVIEELEKGSNVHALAAPLQSLFQGQKGSKKFKQLLSSSNVKPETLIEILNNILEVMPPDILWN